MGKSESTDAVGRFFDGYAADFDAIYGHTRRRAPLERWVDRTFRAVMMRRFEETLRRTANPTIGTVLDVGCGSGRYLLALARQGKKATGVDIAAGMLRLAADAIAEAGVEAHVDLVQGDYLENPFETPFDAACLMGFFDYVEDPEPVLRKLAREVRDEIYASFPKSGGVLAWQRRVRYRARGCPLWMYRRRDVEQLFRSAGYATNVEILDLGRDLFVAAKVPPR